VIGLHKGERGLELSGGPGDFPPDGALSCRRPTSDCGGHDHSTLGLKAHCLRKVLVAALFACAALQANTANASAQAGTFVVRGRVLERGQERPIAQALVVFDEDRRATTNAIGEFEIRGLQAGRYTLLVEALGYLTVRTTMLIEGNGTVQIQMDPAPLPLPPVRAATSLVTVQARVTNESTGEIAPYVIVRLDNRDQASTNAAGWFRFRRIPAGMHRLALEGFGWLPIEIDVDVARDTTLALTLKRDPVADRIIAVQVGKLAERVRSVGYSVRTIDRKEFLFSRAPTPVEIIQSRGGVNIESCARSRVRACVGGLAPIVYIDDRRTMCGLEVLTGYPNATIQRIEVIDRGKIIRIYTIWFIERMNEGRTILEPIVTWDRRSNEC
jgi:hypothetical protein